jgi:alpha-glucosidase
MKKIYLLVLIVIVILNDVISQEKPFVDSLKIKVDANTFWWMGIIEDGHKMPLTKNYHSDFRLNSFGNQVQPLLLSNNGEVIWSDDSFVIDFSNNNLILHGNKFQFDKAGSTLKDAYHFASKNYFPPSGKLPDPLLFTKPQYNTWIELQYNQNQKDVMTYARNILANGLPAGVLMIDDNWQEDYGNWNFHPGRFSNPKQMIDSLHQLGFKVMLWVCPFVSPDSYLYRELKGKKYFVTDASGNPALIKWWNGVSAELDFTNPDATIWFKSQLTNLTNNYGVDGFKLDAGDFEFYDKVNSFKKDATATDHSEAYGKIGLDYSLNEYRAMWKMGGLPLGQRLHDKNHGFGDLQFLIPNMIIEGLNGYYFSCPDMIGGGDNTAFVNNVQLDQESIVRSAQCHALMPMMQFSVAPWRVLDKVYFEAIKKAVTIREKFVDYILELAINTSKSGEPILKSMEFEYPHQGYEKVIDQFIMGDKLLVAPVLTKAATERTVIIPEGKWKSFNGQIINGPKTIQVKVTINDLPYFEKVK